MRSRFVQSVLSRRLVPLTVKKELLVRVGVFVVAGRAEQDALAGDLRASISTHVIRIMTMRGGEDQRRAE